MKRLAILSTAVAAAVLVPSVASADIIQGSPTAFWRNFPGPLNSYLDMARPYWDNASRDVTNPNTGGPQNIGNYLRGPFSTTISPSVSSPGIDANWWGRLGLVGETFDRNVTFQQGNTDRTVIFTLMVESTNNANSNALGWYDVDNPSNRALIWSGQSSPTSDQERSFDNLPEHWGLYMVTPRGTYCSQALLGMDDNYQHFAFFQTNDALNNEVYYIGVEDLNVGTADPESFGDFNDMIFRIVTVPGGNPVPEPSSLALLGLGAAALLTRRKR